MSHTSTTSLSRELPATRTANQSRRNPGLALVKGYAPHGYRLHVSNHAAQPAANAQPVAPPVHRDVSTRFGSRLRQLRIERKLTQIRMAREFGVDRSYISDVERGRKSVSLPTMEILALGLKVSLAELLAGI